MCDGLKKGVWEGWRPSPEKSLCFTHKTGEHFTFAPPPDNAHWLLLLYILLLTVTTDLQGDLDPDLGRVLDTVVDRRSA